MAIDYLNKNGFSYFWSKLKAYFAPKAHTHTAFETKHSYTTAANAAKNWYRIANANTSQTDTTKPIHAQFILTAYNTSYDASYYERWFVNAEVFGRIAHIVIFGNTTVPFSQARILYENTIADLDTNDRPAIDIYLNYKLANGTTKIEIEEVYNSGWTFVADGQLVASTVPSGFENVACGIRGNGVERSTYADYVSYLQRQISDITAAFTLADTWLYRSRTLNCTGTFTITIPSINSGYMWCVIKNKNTSSGVITLHPSTTSVLIDGSNADITLQPMEYVCIHSAGANNYSLIADGRWKSQKADKATTLAGYGITDAKIANGTITLGSSSITPLTSHQTLPTLSRTISGSGNAITDITVSNHAITATKGSTFALDSNVIHKEDNEVIEGTKTFQNSYHDSTREGEEDYTSSSLLIRIPDYDKGTDAETNHHGNIVILDRDGTNQNWNGRLGLFEHVVYEGVTRANQTRITAYRNIVSGGEDFQEYVALGVGYDEDGNKYSVAPSTSSSRNNGNDILTRDWIPNDTRIVHTTGNEDIHGSKKFFDRNLCVKSNTIEKGVTPSDNLSITIPFLDKNNSWVGMVDFIQRTSGAYDLKLGCYNQSTNVLNCIYCGTDADGINYAQAASTSSSRSAGIDIVTRDWIPKDTRIVHTTGNETVAGVKTFSNDIVLNASSPDILFYNSTMTKGTNPSETMWNEILFCDKTGNRDAAYRLGQIAAYVDTNGQASIGLYAYNWASGSTSQSSIGVSYPKNGTAYTWAPTPATSDNSTKMATTAFVKAQGYLTSHQSLDSCVKTSGAQTIGGIKTFTASPEIKRDNPYIYFIETDQTRWTSANSTYQGIFLCDKNTTEMAALLCLNYANQCALRLYTYSKGTSFGNTYLELAGAGSGTAVKNFSPYPTKGCSLGDSNHLYTQLYANTTTISTSDEKEKSNIESIPDEVLDAWEEVSFCSFQFNDALAQKGEAARIHSGLVSQRVYEIFGRHGLDGFRYAFLCRDQGEAVDRDEKKPDGTVHHFHEDAYDSWGIRYEEALCMEAACQRRRADRAEARIAALEGRLAALELRLGSE